MKLKVAIDCDVSPKMVTILGSLYGARGFEFVKVSDFATVTDEDEIWADSFKRFGGSVVLSGNKKIGTKPHQALAFIENGFLSFFMNRPWSEMRGHMKAAHLVYWWQHIEPIINSGVRSKCFRVPCDERDGKLILESTELKEMVIPEAVLAEVKRSTAGR